MNHKQIELMTLDLVCECVAEKYGTLNTNGLALDYHISKQVERCERVGATREEINQILKKYAET
jgi:hypothetical protein